MEKLYKNVDGVEVEYSAEDYAQAEIDKQYSLQTILPNRIRDQRNKLLAKSDWTQFVDSPLTSEQKQAWALYRQELRDITNQTGFPTDVVFPEQPS